MKGTDAFGSRVVWKSPGVTVWHGRLDRPDCLADHLSVLSASETAQAQCYRSALEQRRFIVRRAFLRRVLSSAIGTDPASLDVIQDGRGKPCLPDGSIEFNLSSSGEDVLVAVSSSDPIGVDVETVVNDFDFTALLADHFTDKEALTVHEFGIQAFFAMWTLKEACSKASGIGLGCPLKAYDVSRIYESRSPSSVAAGTPLRLTAWTLDQIPGAAAAVAVLDRGQSRT